MNTNTNFSTILSDVRAQFPALKRDLNGQRVVYLDGPAGSQVPQCVADAVSHYLFNNNANCGAPFATSSESDAALNAAYQTVAEFLGTPDPACITFGPNMTTLTFALSRALGKTWTTADEIIVTRLDHDANVSPWILAANDAGATVHQVEIHEEDCTLNLDDFHAKLSERTALVAVGYASNAVGTINPLKEMIASAHAVNAKVFVDAVHYAPHGLIDVTDLDCDFLAASAYKFFGPHVGMLYGKREWLEELTPYKLRPATNLLPGKWMTGTQNHEGICGVAAAVDYLAGIGETLNANATTRRDKLIAAFTEISLHETALAARLLQGLATMEAFKIWGIVDHEHLHQRVPTISVTHRQHSPREIATELGKEGIFAWPGNHYALPLTETLGLEPGGTLRMGLLHYNTLEEVDRVLNALSRWGS